MGALSERQKGLIQTPFRFILPVDFGRAGLLAELVAAPIVQKRQMQIAGRCISKGLDQRELAAAGGQQIHAANDVGYALVVIVDHHHKLVGEQAVGPTDDEIATILMRALPLQAQVAIIKVVRTIIQAKPPGPRHGAFGQSGAAVAGVGPFAGRADRDIAQHSA